MKVKLACYFLNELCRFYNTTAPTLKKWLEDDGKHHLVNKKMPGGGTSRKRFKYQPDEVKEIFQLYGWPRLDTEETKFLK